MIDRYEPRSGEADIVKVTEKIAGGESFLVQSAPSKPKNAL